MFNKPSVQLSLFSLISVLLISGCNSSTPPNQKPKALSKTVTLLEDSTKLIPLEATDEDNNPLTYAIVQQPQHGVFDFSSKTYTPTENYHGSDSFTFKANDGKDDSAIATVTITVNPVNDNPIAEALNVTLAEDSTKLVSLQASDIDADDLTYHIVRQPTKGGFNLATKIYEPNANYHGTDSFTYKANDGTIDSNTVTVNITVSPVNDKPLAENGALVINENTAKQIALQATDIDGDRLSYNLVQAPAHGSFDITTQTYTPTTNYNGADSFTFKVNDGTVDSAPASITVTVKSVNDAPVATAQTVSFLEDTSKTITLVGTDTDGDDLTYSVVTAPAHGTFDGTTYTPTANYHGDDSFTFKANDGLLDSIPATISLVISSVNDAPTVSIDTNTTGMILPEYNVTFDAVANDVDGTVESYRWVEGVTELSTEASFSKNDFSGGEHTITLTVVDNDGDTATETVTINVWQPTIIGETNEFGAGGDVLDITLSSDGNRAYLASNQKGLTIVNIEDPNNPAVVNTFDTNIDSARSVSLSADGSKAYIADFGKGLKIIDVSNESNPQLLGEIANTLFFDVKVRELNDNRVIAYILDRTQWLKIIDITDPVNPITHGELNIGLSTNYKIQLSNDGSRTFIAHAAGVHIINVSDIDAPVLIDTIPTHAYDIRLSADNKKVYVVGIHNSTPSNVGFGIYNIDESDTNFKQLIGSYIANGANGNQRGLEIHQKDDKTLAYLFETIKGVQIIDITDPATPRKIITTNTDGVEHAGAISQDGTKAYVIYGTGPGFKGMRVVDVDIPVQLP